MQAAISCGSFEIRQDTCGVLHVQKHEGGRGGGGEKWKEISEEVGIHGRLHAYDTYLRVYLFDVGKTHS